jgi:hypothetical protein
MENVTVATASRAVRAEVCVDCGCVALTAAPMGLERSSWWQFGCTDRLCSCHVRRHRPRPASVARPQVASPGSAASTPHGSR